MQTHYEINVSLNGKHFFATSERSAQTAHEAKNLMGVFAKKFPETEGFEVSCTYWRCSGRTIDRRNL